MKTHKGLCLLLYCAVYVYPGAGESGKSTVVKQLKLIYRGKMKRAELEGYTQVRIVEA